MRVLVVDDRKRTRQSLALLLRTINTISEIWEAADGSEAVSLIPEIQPDVVIMDAKMPKMDGIQATGIIKESWPHIHVIVLSMYPEYRVRALDAGADIFTSKGEPPEELVKAIGEIASEETASPKGGSQ
jgi:DNA-binding NarL/FixJ family response regulator